MAASKWLKTQSKDFCVEGIQKAGFSMLNFFFKNGDYIEKWSKIFFLHEIWVVTYWKTFAIAK